ncbi:MAG: hypothetical protein K9L59_16170 [Desulfobacterales bacterium]|nr:hypothetical protein [Desulfobacterales bacterium]
MDTNDLTEKTYEILKLSEDIDHIITVHIGAMCGRYNDEDMFLSHAFKFITGIMDAPDEFIEDWGIEEGAEPGAFKSGLSSLKGYIQEVMAIPYKERGMTIEERDSR